MFRTAKPCSILIAAMVIALTSSVAQAGPLREWLSERRDGGGHERGSRFGGDANGGALSELFGGSGSCADRAAKMEKKQTRAGVGPRPDLSNVAYGSKAKETLDVFYAKNVQTAAPVIVMVHGGGWCIGDKILKNVTENKVARWVPKGFVFVSVNYPMVADGSMARAQGQSVAQSLAYVQHHAQQWGGDPSRIILMGHSAGGHLVSLVNADADMRANAGVKPVLGTISIDSGSTNTVSQIQNLSAARVKKRFEEAFGTDPKGWEEASPYHQLSHDASPWFGICTKRNDDPCGQAEEYAKKSNSMGIRAEVYPVSLSHGKSNAELGKPSEYTSAVEQFMASLDPVVASLLK